MRKSLCRGTFIVFLLLCANASFAFTTILFVEESCDGSKAANYLAWVVVDPPPYTVLRDGIAIATTSNINYYDTAVVPGSFHTYVVTSVNGSVTTRSNERTVQTPLCNRLPGRPVVTVSEICNLGVTPHRAGVHISWIAAANADYYEVRRDNGATVLQSLITTDLSFDDLSPLTPGVRYDYTVGVVTRLNGSNSSNQAFITTSATTACPPLPEAFTLSGSAACDLNPAVPTPTVALTWTKSLNATSYQILRDGAAYATTSATTYTDANLVAGQTYAYAIRASNNSGTIDSNAITVPVSASICHVAPGAFSLSTGTYCFGGDRPSVQIWWSQAKSASSYTIYRDGVAIRLPGPPSFTSLEDYEVLAGHSYNYLVRASNDYGTTEASAVVNTPANICFPAAPASLLLNSACDHNAPVVYVSWSPALWASGYQVSRDGISVSGILPASTATFADHSAVAGKSYKYVVSASNRHGSTDSAFSNVSVSSDVCPVAARSLVMAGRAICDQGSPAVKLEWTPPANVSGYTIYRNAAPIATVAGSAVTFTDTAVVAGQSYAYFVRGETADALYESDVIVALAAACPTQPAVPPRHRGVRH